MQYCIYCTDNVQSPHSRAQCPPCPLSSPRHGAEPQPPSRPRPGLRHCPGTTPRTGIRGVGHRPPEPRPEQRRRRRQTGTRSTWLPRRRQWARVRLGRSARAETTHRLRRVRNVTLPSCAQTVVIAVLHALPPLQSSHGWHDWFRPRPESRAAARRLPGQFANLGSVAFRVRWRIDIAGAAAPQVAPGTSGKSDAGESSFPRFDSAGWTSSLPYSSPPLSSRARCCLIPPTCAARITVNERHRAQ